MQSDARAVADTAYTAGFYRGTAPSHLAFTAIAGGFSPGPALQPRRMLELGFGQGFGLALLAAANPDVAFEGCDLSEEHVAHARRLVDSALLENVTLSQVGFEDAAMRAGEDDVDVVATHGVLSWIPPAARDAVVAIVRKRLRAQGLFYVSYNCWPGWAPIVPIRDLARVFAARTTGGAQEKLSVALQVLADLRRRKAAYLGANPQAARHLDDMLRQDPRYLIHEYLDDHWEPLHFADVAALMADAGLRFAASATLAENIDQCAVPADVLPLLLQIPDPVLRETVRDFGANKQFRRDVYARGGSPLAPDQRHHLWSQLRFALIVPRNRLMFRFLGPLTELNGNPSLYDPIADRLTGAHASFEELLALPEFGAGRAALLCECLTLLVHSGQVLPLACDPCTDTAPARRFNHMVIAQVREGRLFDGLASPVVRSGVPMTDYAMLALSALLDGKGHDAIAAAEHGLTVLKSIGRFLTRNMQPIEGAAEAVAFLAEEIRPVLEERVPLWRTLGML